jgi:hypothetical protein
LISIGETEDQAKSTRRSSTGVEQSPESRLLP